MPNRVRQSASVGCIQPCTPGEDGNGGAVDVVRRSRVDELGGDSVSEVTLVTKQGNAQAYRQLVRGHGERRIAELTRHASVRICHSRWTSWSGRCSPDLRMSAAERCGIVRGTHRCLQDGHELRGRRLFRTGVSGAVSGGTASSDGEKAWTYQ